MCLERYKNLVFDCDGVILDSNKVKRDAFYYAAIPYGEMPARALVQYHTQNGGISRFVKFEKFLREMVGQPVTEAAMQELLDRFEQASREGLLECAITPGLAELKSAYPDARWMVVSGASQSELNDVFSRRGIDHWFDAGIFGSPDSKDEILSREIASGNLVLPALFFGDSRYDHLAATRAGLDFVFISGWTEFDGWEQYCAHHRLVVWDRICDTCKASPDDTYRDV
jgi:phosphoglycolate phosphatase-like HAD superfamily hydrolase